MLRWLRLRDEDTVDAVLHAQFNFKRLDVHVACAALHRFEQDEVHEIDERWLLSHPVHVICLDRVEVVLAVWDGCEAAVGGERFRHTRGGRPVAVAHQVAKRGRIEADAANRSAGDCRDLIDRGGIEWIEHRDKQALPIDTEGNRAEANGDFRREEFRRCGVRSGSLL